MKIFFFIILLFLCDIMYSQNNIINDLIYYKKCSCYCLKKNEPFTGKIEEWVFARDKRVTLGRVHELYLILGTLYSNELYFDEYRMNNRYLIKVKGEIINGKENGIWEYFLKGKNEELLLIAKISFCNGVLDGSYIIYYSTGKIQILGKNCLGIPCGKWLYFDN